MADATAAPKARNPSWNKGDDVKLLGLLQRGDVDPHAEHSQANIEAIRKKYFSHIVYRNFRGLLIKKSAQFITDGTLKGANKPSGAEDGSTMPKKKAAEAKAVTSPSALADNLNELSFGDTPQKPYSFDVSAPSMTKKYTKNERDVVEVEITAHPLDESFFLFKLSDDGRQLDVGQAVPEAFAEMKRMKKQMGEQWKKNDPRVVAHSDVVQEVRKAGLVKDGKVWGKPQTIQLPEPCEGPPAKKRQMIPIGVVPMPVRVQENGQDVTRNQDQVQFVQVITLVFKTLRKRQKKEKKAQLSVLAALSEDSDDDDIDRNDDDYESDDNMST
ncbi:hypothetical protein ACHAXT_009722 [Thalassiosira profunda]